MADKLIPFGPNIVLAREKRNRLVITHQEKGIAIEFLADTGTKSNILAQKCFNTLQKLVQ